MKKVLIITYYWPPAGGPGVQRVLKFVKYLPQFGWQPIVLTVENGEYPAYDESLLNEIPSECKVYKTKALEPFSLYKRFVGMKSEDFIPVATLVEKKINWKKKLSNWIRLNFFIPDAKIGWIPFAVKEGKKIIKAEKPDMIFSSSPPPTVHLIARKLAKWGKLKWVADFRDPWTEIHYYEKQKRLYVSKAIDSKLEKIVINNSDAIVCVSKNDMEEYFAKFKSSNCFNIPNGYDDEDFQEINQTECSKNYEFTILHLGAVGIEREPATLFKVINRIIQDKKINQVKLVFVGPVDKMVVDKLEKNDNLFSVDFIDYLPHNEALSIAMKTDLLLLLITKSKLNKRILPGKTFEYLKLNKPILVLGPENGEVARIINETQAGKVLEYENEAGIEDFLVGHYKNWIDDNKDVRKNENLITYYSRKNLTKMLTNIFEKMEK